MKLCSVQSPCAVLFWVMVMTVPLAISEPPKAPPADACVASRYDNDWFLQNKMRPGLIENQALFYTYDLSRHIQDLVKQCDNFYVSIWNICRSQLIRWKDIAPMSLTLYRARLAVR